MRQIEVCETYKLEECLKALAEYHNEVSVNFKGSYPSRPFEDTLKLFEEALSRKKSHIAVVEDHGRVIGFCKIDIGGVIGKLDYLVVLGAYRGKGYGKALVDWALNEFDNSAAAYVDGANSIVHGTTDTCGAVISACINYAA